MPILRVISFSGVFEIFFPDNGPVKCFAVGWPMYFESHLECFFFQLPFFLETIGFGYICILTVAPIILISLFGGIKENYRWFLLNQAFWDILVSYNFICNKPTYNSYFSWFVDSNLAQKAATEWNQGPPTCFYSVPKYSYVYLQLLEELFISTTKNASYSPLVLLTVSRVLGLYFHHFYERHSTKLKTAIIIVFFNLITLLLVNAANLLRRISTAAASIEIDKCYDLYCEAITSCNETFSECSGDAMDYSDRMKENFASFQSAFDVMEIVIPMILLTCSCIFALLLILKIGSNLRYQFHHNRVNFSSTFRISLVISFQCLTLSFLLSHSLYNFYWDKFPHGFYDARNPIADAVFSLDLQQPYMVIRVFLDSLISVVILTEYRRTFVKFFQIAGMKGLKMVRKFVGKESVTLITPENRGVSSTTMSSFHR